MTGRPFLPRALRHRNYRLYFLLWLSLIFLVIIGLGFMIQMTSSNTLLQTIVESDKRGRVMSFYTMAVMGLSPFGSLLAGGVAHTIGVAFTLRFGGVGCILAAWWFARTLPMLQQEVRPIYVKIGILSETTSDIRHATKLCAPPAP